MVSPRYRILFPVDFSDRSVSAAPYVKIWVDRFGAVLDTLHVIDNRELRPEDDELRSLIERRTADLKYFSDHHFGEHAASSTVLSGSIADEIEYFAKHEKVDLIMLPRDHQHLTTRFLHDSLAATLLERCAALVWITEYLEEVPPVRSILCAMHFEQDASLDAQGARMLQTVQELASRFQARVAFLHVLHGHDQASNESVTDLGTVAEVEPWAVKAQELFGSSVGLLRRSGDVIAAIGDTAKQLAADLIVVGRTSPGTIGLGSQSHILKIDHAAHRPVLSVW
jgi:nucleotide-binding universal stress UspA family protein